MIYSSATVLCLLLIGCVILPGVDALQCFRGSVQAPEKVLPQLRRKTCDHDHTLCYVKIHIDHDRKKLVEYSHGCGNETVFLSAPYSTTLNLTGHESCAEYLVAENNFVFHCWCRTNSCNNIGSQSYKEVQKNMEMAFPRKTISDWVEHYMAPTTTIQPTTILTTPEITTPITTKAPSTSNTEATTESSTKEITTQADPRFGPSHTPEQKTTVSLAGDRQTSTVNSLKETTENTTVLVIVTVISGAAFLSLSAAIVIIYLRYLR